MSHHPALADRARSLRRAGRSYREIAEELSVPRATVQRWVQGTIAVGQPDPSAGGRFPELAALVGKMDDDQLVGMILACIAEASRRGIDAADYVADTRTRDRNRET